MLEDKGGGRGGDQKERFQTRKTITVSPVVLPPEKRGSRKTRVVPDLSPFPVRVGTVSAS